MTMNIPSHLWQTYKTNPPPQAYELINTWKIKNPNMSYEFFNDDDCEYFINSNFDSKFYKMYKSLPFGVMKSDVWRVAVVYIHGGIYADLDCRCMVPVTEWLNPEDELIVAVENPNGSLANFAFAAKPKHPALKHVLDTFVELYNSPYYLDKNTATPIQNFGQHGFSKGILSYYSLDDLDSMDKGGTSNFYNEEVIGTGTKFILQQDKKFTNGLKPNNYITHHVASVTWGGAYDSWRKQQRGFLQS